MGLSENRIPQIDRTMFPVKVAIQGGRCQIFRDTHIQELYRYSINIDTDIFRVIWIYLRVVAAVLSHR